LAQITPTRNARKIADNGGATGGGRNKPITNRLILEFIVKIDPNHGTILSICFFGPITKQPNAKQMPENTAQQHGTPTRHANTARGRHWMNKAARVAPIARPLTGNEAIARGVWEAGVKVAAA